MPRQKRRFAEGDHINWACSTWSGDLPQHQRSPSFHRGGSSEGQFDWTSNVTNDPAEPNALAGLGPDSPEASTGSSDAKAALPLSIDLVDPSNEFLLTYFSHHIAPQMVVMDDKYNGWRYLILPFALSDKMVMDAVLAVSAFHLSHKTRGTLSVRPDKLYAKAILGLQSRSSLNEYDMLTKQSIFVAIITLLVGVMVNGCSDFPILFNMLQSALDAVGGEGGLGNGDMTDFLLRQIRKFRVYAAPLLSEEAGVRSIVAHAKESFDCLHYNGNLHPDHALTFYLNAYLRQQAYDIYLERALTGPHGTLDPGKIERFKETLELFPEGSLGEHSLILDLSYLSGAEDGPQSLIKGAQIPDRAPFDAEKHVNFKFPQRIITMKDIGLEGVGITSTAISEPFTLFTVEAIRQMRAEIFSRQVLEKYQVGSDLATNMIRAGIELVPAMDVDIGHVNISVRDDAATTSAPDSDADDKVAFEWHSDSYTFVCVTMLSDCAGMIGGETVIRTGTGKVLKFRGPAMGTAVIMQGRYIEHQALEAFGGRERISMVTSLRPKSPFVRDETSIRPLLPITPRNTLYYQYVEYRLENLEERVRHQLKVIRQQKKANRDFDVASARKFLLEERDFIDAILEEQEDS
ncbi:hypothetical protein APSETT444_007504 [Aspergillus pseudonomiae]